MVYNVLMTVIPATRLSIFKLVYIDSQSYCNFLLGVSVGVSILVVFLQKCVFIPLFRWVKESEEEKEKEKRKTKHQ